MTTLEKIYDLLHEYCVDVIDCRLKGNVAVAFEDGYVGLDTHRVETSMEAASHLGHEAGHFISGEFYHAWNRYEDRSKAEFRASKAMWLFLMPPEDVQAAIDTGYTENWQLAEWFGLMEDDVCRARKYYLANGLLKDLRNVDVF